MKKQGSKESFGSKSPPGRRVSFHIADTHFGKDMNNGRKYTADSATPSPENFLEIPFKKNKSQKAEISHQKLIKSK